MEQMEIYTKAGARLLTADSVAELAGCKVATLDAYLSRGQMPAPLGAVGRTRLWSRADVDGWLALRGREQPLAAQGGEQTSTEEGGEQTPAEDGGDLIPAELRALRRWTRHDHKRPIRTNGDPASPTDPLTWTTYPKAKASKVGDGVGFVLNGDGIAGLDLNDCVVDGVLSPAAQDILDLLPDTYAEISPSGHGVRLFCYAKVTKGRRFVWHGVEMEICGTRRFLTVTGDRLPGRPSVLADNDSALRSLTPRA